MKWLTRIPSSVFQGPILRRIHFSTSHTSKSIEDSTTSQQNNADTKPMRIAILGGGITGLTAAFYASRQFPHATITLFERSQRLGGIIDSAHTRVGNTSIVCDTGPRTIRANAPRAIVTLDLIRALNLTSRLLLVPKRSPAASSRYILSPHTGRPVRIPTSAHLLPHALPATTTTGPPSSSSSFTSPTPPSIFPRLPHFARLLLDPLFAPLLPGLLRDALLSWHPSVRRGHRRAPPPPSPSSSPRPRHDVEEEEEEEGEEEEEDDDNDDDDESVHAFVSRRWGGRLADGLGSAVVMGVWAGCVERLSARACMPGLWAAEGRLAGGGGLGLGGVVGEVLLRRRDGGGGGTVVGGGELVRRLREGEAGALERALRMREEVSVYNFAGGMGELVGALAESVREAPNVDVVMGADVVGIEPVPRGVNVTVNNGFMSSQSFTHVVACTSLNHVSSAVSRTTSISLPLMGEVTVMVVTLCYTSPSIHRPYYGFGYIIPRSVPHSVNPERAIGVVFDSDALVGQDDFEGTKIAVMLGGCWWNGMVKYPNPDEAEMMARKVLERHLNITAKPVKVMTTLHRNAIPQYEVGHYRRMALVRKALLDGFDGRLRVAGKSYGGIAVHDCIFSARSVAEALDQAGLTGLESFAQEAQ